VPFLEPTTARGSGRATEGSHDMRILPSRVRSRSSKSPRAVAITSALRSGGGWVAGEFTLPVPALWGGVRLPVGRYALLVPSWSPVGVAYAHRPECDALVVARAVETRTEPLRDEIVLVRREARCYVASLALRGPRVVLHFDVPRALEDADEARWRSAASRFFAETNV
jgi:hypothetical protein